MTENEAIKILKKTTEHTKVYEDDVVFTSDFVKAYEKAIQALEEIQQYRAIGTVEELQALKEKSVAKKPIDKIMYLECPTCGDVGILDCGYCSVCGQKLDWQ